MTPLRILYTVHGYKPAYRIGGPVLSVSAVAENVVKKGHEVTVLTTNSNLDQELDVPINRAVDVSGVEVWYFRREDPFKRWLPFFTYMSKSVGFLYAPDMGQHLTSVTRKFDLVHTHLPFIYPTYAGARAANAFGKPLFYHQRGVFDPERLKFRPLKKLLYINALEKRIMRRATTLIALTDAEVQSYRNLGIRTRCSIVPNGIDSSSYRTQPRGELSRFGLPSDALVVLFLGRLHPTKGAEKLLAAFLKIQGRFPNSFLVLAGPDEFRIESTMRSVIQEAGVSKRVLFPGMVSGEEKLDLLARADLFCLPSVGEGFSIAILEALASETPVLISPGCHFPELEANGVGRIIDPEPAALANVMAEMLLRPQQLKEMGKRARTFVNNKYSVDRVAERLLDVYYEGIERHKKRKANEE